MKNILTFIVILAVVVGGYFLIKKDKTEPILESEEISEEQVASESDVNEYWGRYENKELGISFDYPAQIIEPEREDIEQGIVGLSFDIEIGPLYVGGVSENNESHGRDGWYLDMSESQISSSVSSEFECPEGLEDLNHIDKLMKVRNADGVEGTYGRGLLMIYDRCSPASDPMSYVTEHYVAFDEVPGFRSFVFVGRTEAFSEQDFLRIVESFKSQ